MRYSECQGLIMSDSVCIACDKCKSVIVCTCVCCICVVLECVHVNAVCVCT